jgi:threonine/homoserine/homoserine lactone efflux protein
MAYAVLAVLWIAGCAALVWLVWRAARQDMAAQQRAEEPPAKSDDRAA